mmetsp:Transcript_9307/g.25148  ORF Transcript_9307/g.25148 Transcript_9307/m.25148 type:complete len:254 (+) Transcript_9307:27-788(+)
MAYHAPHGVGPGEVESGREPCRRLWVVLGPPPVEDRWVRLEHNAQPFIQSRLFVLLGRDFLVVQLFDLHVHLFQLPGIVDNDLGDQRTHRLGVGDPLDQSRVLADGHHGKATQVQVAFPCVWLFCEKGVQNTRDLHHPAILPQVVLRLGQERIRLPITPDQDDALGLLEAGHHGDVVLHSRDRNEWLVFLEIAEDAQRRHGDAVVERHLLDQVWRMALGRNGLGVILRDVEANLVDLLCKPLAVHEYVLVGGA